MRNGRQARAVGEPGKVFQQLHRAALVGCEEGPQGEQGEQLVRGEILARELGGIVRQALLGQAQRFAGYGAWRVRHHGCSLYTYLHAPMPRGFQRCIGAF